MTHGRVFCFHWKARASKKLNKNFSVAVIFQNENELVTYIPFGLDINAWHTPEKTELYLPSHKPFRRYFSLIFSWQPKIKSQFFSFKHFKETVNLPITFWNAPPYLPNFSDIIKMSSEFVPWSMMFYDSFLRPVYLSISISLPFYQI